MQATELKSAEQQVWQQLRNGGAQSHALWLKAGEFAAAHNNLRRALGCWRRALEVDFRGEKTVVLHEGIATLSQVLLQQKKYFLHVHEDSVRQQWLATANAPVLVNPPKAELEAALLAARESRPSLQGIIDQARRCVARQQFEDTLADVSLVLDLKNAGLVAVAAQFQQFQLWYVDSLLNRQEPLP